MWNKGFLGGSVAFPLPLLSTFSHVNNNNKTAQNYSVGDMCLSVVRAAGAGSDTGGDAMRGGRGAPGAVRRGRSPAPGAAGGLPAARRLRGLGAQGAMQSWEAPKLCISCTVRG